ncbi:MAG: hypothetical protein KJZ80_18860 [Hyphomicrobiaceae bacterium]|nr:hypothetical protein [Hyphomicrobiaceae bacterium]
MTSLRILSGLFLLAATLALISEATRAQLGVPSAPFTPLLVQLTETAPPVLRAIERSARSVHALLWDPMLRSMLTLPAWVVFGAIGLILGWLGRRRRSVDVFTN